jgi:ATP-binding cassette subfamily B protein IrtA
MSLDTSPAVGEAGGTTDRPPALPAPTESPRDLARRSAAALATLRRPVVWQIRVAMGLAAVGALAGLVPFVALAQLGGLLLAPGEPDTRAVAVVGWLVVGGLGLRGLLLGAALTITHLADAALQGDVRRRMVRHLGRVPLGWFSDRSSGVVHKAAQNDVTDVHHLVAHHSVELTAAVVLPIGGLAYLLWLDWRLALLALVTLPFYAAAYAWMMRGFQDRMQQLDTGFARISSAVVEFVSGIAVVKAFGRTGKAHAAYRTAADEFGDMYAG